MSKNKNLNLDRFKKSTHGLIEFAMLIEQADKKNRNHILEKAKLQDEEFIYQVMKRVVYFEELIHLDEAVLAELLSRVSPKVLAFALLEMPEEFRKKMLRNLGIRDRRTFEDEEERFSDGVSRAFVEGARKQVLRTARKLESENKFVLEATNCPRLIRKRAR